MLSLKLAKLENLPEITLLVQQFCLEANLPFVVDDEKIEQSLKRILKDLTKSTLILITDLDIPVGFIVGASDEPLFSSDVIATEIAWYVYPNYRDSRAGLQLFKAFEHWAQFVAKADYIQMMHLNTPRLGKFYEKRGYKKVEEVYMKEISNGS